MPSDAVVVPPRRILVAVDGSEASTRAVETALGVAEASGGAVTCVLAWNLEIHEGVVVTERASERWAAVEQRYSSLGHRTVDPAAARHPGVSVDILVRHGPAARAVVEVAAELDADLVVVGRRGSGRFPRPAARLGQPPGRRARRSRGPGRPLTVRSTATRRAGFDKSCSVRVLRR